MQTAEQKEAYQIEHERRLEMHRQGKTDREIAETCRVNIKTIAGWRKKHGLEPNSPLPERYTHDNRMELYQQGFSDSKIARRVGLSAKAIKSWRTANNLPANYVMGEVTLCWSCPRARALPDPKGCAFHRKEHLPVYDEAIIYNGTVIVTKCKGIKEGRA